MTSDMLNIQAGLGHLVEDFLLYSLRCHPQQEAILQSQARMLDAARVNLLRGAMTEVEAEAWLDAGRVTLAQAKTLTVGDSVRKALDHLAAAAAAAERRQ